MSDRPRTIIVPLLAVLALAVLAAVVLPRRGAARSAAPRQTGQITAAERGATFRFDAQVAPYDRELVVAAVAHARPEAQRLIAAVDGIVDVHIAPTPAGVAGVTEWKGDRYDVTLNLGKVASRYGARGIDRVVLHELGHVVDFALVPSDLDAALDRAIPAGYGCDQATSGGCANKRERFAESFAKWATGDIGNDLYLGYKVPPPDDLQRWGAPLARLAG